MDGEQLVGEVLYGIVKDDQTYRFFDGDYVTTSRIILMDIKARQVITASNSHYCLEGSGKRAIIDLDDFELLRNGFNPEQIRALNHVSSMAH